MRIAVIAHNVRSGGGLVVARNIIGALGRVANHHDFALCLPSHAGYDDITLPARAQVEYFSRTSYFSQWRFETQAIPRMLHAFRPDTILSLAGYAVPYRGARQAVLTMRPHFVYRGTERPRDTGINEVVGALSKRRLARSLPYVDLMVCQTPVAAHRFRASFRYDGPLHLMPPSVSHDLPPREAVPGRPALLSASGGRTLFALAVYSAHKNLEALVDMVRRHGPELGDLRIVVTVSPESHALAPRLLSMLNEPAVRPYFINVGLLSTEELAGYYHHCDGVILPTLLESFSSTYLEAMHFGRPILTSDLDFARDNCGSAALYFNPSDPSAIRDAILSLMHSPGLAASLVTEGDRQLRRFGATWDERVLSLMSDLLAVPDASAPVYP